MVLGISKDADEKTNTVNSTEYVRIVMTPEHAKLFGYNLLSSLKQYEKKFGPIRTPIMPKND
jgi:hypothetical protein